MESWMEKKGRTESLKALESGCLGAWPGEVRSQCPRAPGRRSRIPDRRAASAGRRPPGDEGGLDGLTVVPGFFLFVAGCWPWAAGFRLLK